MSSDAAHFQIYCHSALLWIWCVLQKYIFFKLINENKKQNSKWQLTMALTELWNLPLKCNTDHPKVSPGGYAYFWREGELLEPFPPARCQCTVAETSAVLEWGTVGYCMNLWCHSQGWDHWIPWSLSPSGEWVWKQAECNNKPRSWLIIRGMTLENPGYPPGFVSMAPSRLWISVTVHARTGAAALYLIITACYQEHRTTK